MSEPAPLWLTTLNTALILISGACLLVGYAFIRRKQVVYHRRSMLTAVVFAGLFLVVYVTRAVLFEAKLFAGEGLVRVAYLVVLVSHIIIAIAIVPLVLVTLRRALRGEFVRHRRVARLTLPLWLYVVVTGWLVYAFLYLF